jgi:hypothetical protein
MPAFALRFVGQEALPPRLSEFDRGAVLHAHVGGRGGHPGAVPQRPPPARRADAAVHARGRPTAGRFQRAASKPPAHTAQVLAVSPPSIASLRSIYKRRQTLSKHQLWAKTYLGLRELEPDDEAALTAALLAQAADASHADDLVQIGQPLAVHAAHPDPRSAPPAGLGSWSICNGRGADPQRGECRRAAGSGPESCRRRIQRSAGHRHDAPGVAEDAVEASRPQHSCRNRRQGPLPQGARCHDWNLSAVSLAKQQAYARQVQARRPVKTREIKPSRQLIELVCFLRVTLLELTDVALLQTSRRSQQLFREAADKAQSNRVRGTTGLIQQAAKARSVLHDESKTWQARVLEARELLAELGEAARRQLRLPGSQGSGGRQPARARLPGGMKDLDFGGRPGDPGFEQWKSWTDLQRQGVTELKEDVPLPDVGAAWHGLVRDLDPRSGFRAYEACTMMSLRKSLRRGSVWLDHSLSFRERDQMLIPPAEWAVQRDEQVELLGMPKSAADFLEPLLANLMAGMSAVAEAQRRGKIEIGPTACSTCRRSRHWRIKPSRSARARPSTSSSAACSSRTCCWRWMPPPGTAKRCWATARSPPVSSSRCTARCWRTAPMRMPRASRR